MAEITIASVTLNGWSGNTSGISLHIYANEAFTAASGTLYQKAVRQNLASGLGTFLLVFPCTVSDFELTIPAVTLDSTTDSPDNPNASYTAVLWDSNSNQLIQPFGTFPTFTLDNTPAETTWAAIFAAEAL